MSSAKAALTGPCADCSTDTYEGRAMSFVHLHVHSYYSFHDGATSPAALVEKACHFNMPALALTDHNRLTGAIRFYDLARKAGIKPIIGAEIGIEGNYHLTLLCKDIRGYSNLCRLLTTMHCSRRDGRPSATREMLRRYNEGLLALSGCRQGEVPFLLSKKEPERAACASAFYREVFGDDFFIELNHYPSRQGTPLCYILSSFAREQGIPSVATNNVHYLSMQDYRIHELLNAIGLIVPVTQLHGPRTVEQHFKSPAEMERLFRDFPGAAAMTLEIASRCNLELELGKPRFPGFTLPAGETSPYFLRKLAYAGAEKKYGSLSPEMTTRLEMELSTIEILGFCSYFLVVWDIVRWARARGIRLQARGSAVDSMVVYTLDISNADPIHYDLLFERFMHPLRDEPPDIDLDIDRRRRGEVRDYIYHKYGAENVSCVATINTYMARGALRDVGKALQIPPETIEKACKGIHWLSATKLVEKSATLPELKDNTVYRRPELQEFFRLCAAIDGFPKHLSVHLGGLLIGEGRLSDLVPLEVSSGGDIISQYDKDDIERLGLVKMDLLSLPTITVIEDAVRSIKESRGLAVDIDSIPRDDPAPFEMLRSGRTIGVFQLESPAQREMAGRLLPQTFNDIIVTLSLVRPGPLKSSMDKVYLARRHGQEPVSYTHPHLERALSETLGVILYQEQVLRVAHDLAGMSYAGADGFRRAMTHDRTSGEMEKMRLTFINCATRNGVKQDIAEEVFEHLAAFAAYGFCKAHAAAYAILSYQTLWLKCHYPAEFMAAVLSNQPMGYYPPRVLAADARRFGVTVLHPDVNRSSGHYTVENGAIRVGLGQVRGISRETIASIMSERQSRPFSSLRDFTMRTSARQAVVENLVKAGALDTLGSRKGMLAEIPALLQLKRGNGGERSELFTDNPASQMCHCEVAQRPWQSSAPNNIDVTPQLKKERHLNERELLSLDLSTHPLDFCKLENGYTRLKDLLPLPARQHIKIAGSVIRYQTPPTRTGKRVVYIIMEDGTGVADVTVFSDVQEKCGRYLFRSGWLEVQGKIQRRGPKSLSIIADDVRPLRRDS
ncbi:MAG: DNA polymerase III subunit alpha [Dehalococcoidia bacterium]|nr:DNA polymerase III subunit alpha [Dehalococcoidia bacterium]